MEPGRVCLARCRVEGGAGLATHEPLPAVAGEVCELRFWAHDEVGAQQ